jgi:hypothetical protein
MDPLLGGIDLLPMDSAFVERAATLVRPSAIHLASAWSANANLTALVAYDVRLCSAAAEAGIVVASPT